MESESALYSFDIVFEKYERRVPVLDDVRGVYVNNICIISKQNKFGKFYKSKFVKDIKGRFEYSAGSNSSPILYPKNRRVVIAVEGFASYPELTMPLLEHKPFLSIKNVKAHENNS